MEKKTRGVVLCGVGGQGVVLLSDIFTEGLMEMGYDVKKTEQHGMSQRNGSVNAQIKFGEKVFAPVVSSGTANLILTFEKSEALRWLHTLQEGGSLIINDYEIDPVSVQLGDETYPDNAADVLKETVPDTIVVDAVKIGEQCGTMRAQSMVLLGIMVKKLGLLEYDWIAKIKSKVPARYAEANVKAFNEGIKL